MTRPEDTKDFLDWYTQLQHLAQKSSLTWLVSTSPEAHLSAFSHGLKPGEELAELAELAQWRGCGCGGA